MLHLLLLPSKLETNEVEGVAACVAKTDCAACWEEDSWDAVNGGWGGATLVGGIETESKAVGGACSVDRSGEVEEGTWAFDTIASGAGAADVVIAAKI